MELQLRCMAAKTVLPEKRYVVGIGLDAPGEGGGSEDFIYLDTAGWREEQFAFANNMRADLRFFIEGQTIRSAFEEDEYPGGINLPR